MQTTTYEVAGMTCDGCENSVATAVGRVPGVARVVASHADARVAVDFTGAPDDEAVRAAVEDAGFDFVARR